MTLRASELGVVAVVPRLSSADLLGGVYANTKACVYVCARDWLSHMRGGGWAGCGVEVCAQAHAHPCAYKCRHICRSQTHA